MLKIAYLANQFPAAVEPYVGEEILQLRQLGVQVEACSVRKRDTPNMCFSENAPTEIFTLQPVQARTSFSSLALLLRRRKQIGALLLRVLSRGRETPVRRLKALLHTVLGACYAVRLQNRKVEHIHVHHGYFGSWIAMTAARLLGISYSLTLHGSDLLKHKAYLDIKLENCKFCITISDYNRRYILEHFPAVDPAKIVVSRLGVDVPDRIEFPRQPEPIERRPLAMLAVGRLHRIKDHAFLVHACGILRERGIECRCLIAGEGPERKRLEGLIQKKRLANQITLLGQVSREQIGPLYDEADVVVLTSRSEGIPLVLMEAMARRRMVLAPAITGIPELVKDGQTGFLYPPGDVDAFVARISFLYEALFRRDNGRINRLDWIRHAARLQVLHNFNREKNLSQFSDQFLRRIEAGVNENQNRSIASANSILQQIQLSV